MNRGNEYQEWAVNLLTNVLKNSNGCSTPNLLDHGYKYSLKNGVVCHYASMYWNGEEYINMWQTNFNTKRYSGAEKPLLMSEEAFKIISRIKDENDTTQFRDKNNGNKPLLHWEHITPNGYVYNKLLELSNELITKEAVKKCFRHHKIILIAKDEAPLLDGKGQVFTDKDVNLIQCWQKELKSDFTEDIKSMSDGNKYLKCKNFGSGLARIAHLVNCDVKFRKYTSATTEQYGIKEIFDYLEDTDFTYKKEV